MITNTRLLKDFNNFNSFLKKKQLSCDLKTFKKTVNSIDQWNKYLSENNLDLEKEEEDSDNPNLKSIYSVNLDADYNKKVIDKELDSDKCNRLAEKYNIKLGRNNIEKINKTILDKIMSNQQKYLGKKKLSDKNKKKWENTFKELIEDRDELFDSCPNNTIEIDENSFDIEEPTDKEPSFIISDSEESIESDEKIMEAMNKLVDKINANSSSLHENIDMDNFLSDGSNTSLDYISELDL